MNYVYLLRCADGSLYCGWTTDLDARLKAHNSGKGAKYTRSRLPAELVYSESYEERRDALSREWHLKRLSRAEKLALIRASGQSEQTGRTPDPDALQPAADTRTRSDDTIAGTERNAEA